MSLRGIRQAAGRRARTSVMKDSFEVLVMATVSAGKTSLINALIGQELLHAANEATTACVTRVEHRNERKSFAGACYRDSGTVLKRCRDASPELVRSWNADSRVQRITLKGRFESAPRTASGLVVYDTPGPNNSQNGRHGELARKALRSIPYDAMFYIMNAGQLGTHDDRAYLDLLRERVSDAPIYFLLNKVDLLDPEKGEDIAIHARNAHSYLVDAGFADPIVIPTISDAALYARKALNGYTLTRVQRLRLDRALIEFDADKRDVVDAAILPETIKKRMSSELDRLERSAAPSSSNPRVAERHALKHLVARSGIRTAEVLIQYKRSLIRKK